MTDHNATFHKLAAVLDNQDDFSHVVSTLSEPELNDVLMYFVRLRLSRDNAVRKAQQKFKEQMGVSAQWHYTKSNEAAHKKKLESDKMYMRAKRAAESAATAVA